MQDHTPPTGMDIMKMTRLEVAMASRIGAKGFSHVQMFQDAKQLDELIMRQFPDSSSKDRVRLASDLAQKLRDPRPWRLGAYMRLYHNSLKAKKDADDGDEAEPFRSPPRYRED